MVGRHTTDFRLGSGAGLTLVGLALLLAIPQRHNMRN